MDRLPQRIWYALRTTLLQERVFRKRPVLSVFHSFIFYAFVLYLLVNLVDAIEGYVDLPALVSPFTLAAYNALADLFSVLAIIGVLAFVLRRFALPAGQDFTFNERTLLHPLVRAGYIRRDSIIVYAFILFHVGSRVIGNAAKLSLQGTDRYQPFSSLLAPAFATHAAAWRAFGYWGALGSVLLFLAYFPYSKHIHLLMAPVKYLVHREAVSGEFPSVAINLDEPEPKLGAERLADLAWPRLLDAYACIQCNRCQDVCPATQTGKALSPSALEINKRMALNTIAGEASAFSLTTLASFEGGASAGPALLEAVISPEAVWACTTCGACVEVCPTQDEPMLDIIDIRRNQVMLQGEFPAQLQSAFRGMERNSNPWALARDKRMAWAEGLHVPTVDEVPDPDVLYWVGCAASYDASAQKTARAVVTLLAEGGVSFAVLGKRECCTGDSARRAGNELLYQELAHTAIATLQEAKPKLVLASCPHCVNTIATEYPQFGGHFNVMHHTEYLDSMLQAGKLKPSQTDQSVTFHDPCYLGRHRGTYDQPRSLLKVLSNDYVELPRTKNNAFCCGAGGAQFWKEEEPGTERIAENRFREVQETLATGSGEKVLAVGCPFCKSMLQSTPLAGADASIQVKDVAELLLEGVQRAKRFDLSSSARTTTPVAPEPEPSAALANSETPLSLHDSIDASTAPALLPDRPHNGTMAENTAVVPEPAKVERKRWAPKATATAPPITPTVEETSQNPTTVPATERKKWTPKSAAPAPSATSSQPEATPYPSPPTPNVPASVEPPSDPPVARKKWQPGGNR